jgi:hypothetical protein
LESLLAALRNLAGRGLNAEVVLAHLHHRRIVPLMERPLRIFEMTEEADPVALASSGFLQVLSRVFPVVLGDPQGCPRQDARRFKFLNLV